MCLLSPLIYWTKQFDHKGGTFQSPVHKVSKVVPPNAIDDGEKVTVHIGASTSRPFEDSKLRKKYSIVDG